MTVMRAPKMTEKLSSEIVSETGCDFAQNKSTKDSIMDFIMRWNASQKWIPFHRETKSAQRDN